MRLDLSCVLPIILKIRSNRETAYHSCTRKKSRRQTVKKKAMPWEAICTLFARLSAADAHTYICLELLITSVYSTL